MSEDALPQVKSILLVDDNIVLRDRLALAFQERGYEVVVAGGYDEAVAVFTKHPTSLAVLDLRMPGKPGLVLLQTLQQISPETKFLILSGFGSIATAIDAIRLGATNFLPKPADADDILLAFARGDGEVDIPEDEDAIPCQRWLKQSGNTFTASWRIVAATSLKPLDDWEFIVDHCNGSYENGHHN